MKNIDILLMSSKKDAGYGRLYNWFAVNDANFCPTGWHVPTDEEWETLVTELGGNTIAGGKMKQRWDFYWTTPNVGATNESGFSSLGAGYRYDNFYNINLQTYYWSNTEVSLSAYSRAIFSNSEAIIRSSHLKQHGFSVRLIKDDSTNTGNVADYDGNNYPTIKIGDQVWTAKNWKCTKLNNGNSIPEVTDGSAWTGLTTLGRCAYSNDESYV